MFFHPLKRWSSRAPAVIACALASLVVRPAGAAEARLTLAELQQTWALTTRLERAESVLLMGAGGRLRFFPGLRRTEVNNLTVWMNAPCLPVDGNGGQGGSNDWSISAADRDACLWPALLPTNGLAAEVRVMLDPGHGGEDGGASTHDGSVVERDFTLDLAQRIGRRLEAAGLTVGYTRQDDRFVSLAERGATAATWRAQAFVSLHANYAHNRSAAGRETYVLPVAGFPTTAASPPVVSPPSRGNSNDVLNALLGIAIHRQLPGRTRTGDRGLRRARYQVLRQAPCPAALVECGFLSNHGDAALLRSNWYRERLAQAISDGIVDYTRRLPPSAFAGDPPLAVVRESPLEAPPQEEIARLPPEQPKPGDFVGPPWPPPGVANDESPLEAETECIAPHEAREE